MVKKNTAGVGRAKRTIEFHPTKEVYYMLSHPRSALPTNTIVTFYGARGSEPELGRFSGQSLRKFATREKTLGLDW
jgi:hypothetical protein